MVAWWWLLVALACGCVIGWGAAFSVLWHSRFKRIVPSKGQKA